MRHQDPRRRGRRRPHCYGTRPYAHLRTEFEQRLKELLDAGERPDPRDAQAARLKDEIARLKERLSESDATISELTGFRSQALARLAAQHNEITRLRQEVRLAAGIARSGLVVAVGYHLRALDWIAELQDRLRAAPPRLVVARDLWETDLADFGQQGRSGTVCAVY